MRIELTYYSDEACTKPDPAGLYFRGVDAVEVGAASAVISKEWLRVVCSRGYAFWTAYFDVYEGKGISNTGQMDTRKYDPDMKPPNQDYKAIPDGTRMVRVEGSRDSSGTQVTARLLPLGK